MKRILLVKTSSLGDVIHNLPVINDILRHFPQAQIDWVVEESFADIPKLHPAIKTVIPVAMRRWRKNLFRKKTWCEIAALKHILSIQRYDVIIDTQGLIKSALITRFADGERHGYDKNSIREPLASWFYEKTHTISYQQNAVTRNRTLAAFSLGYSPPTEAPDYGLSGQKNKNDASVTSVDIDSHSSYIVALHATSRESKLWPVLHWVALGKHLEGQHTNLLLPWATDAERQRAEAIAASLSNAKVLPRCSIAQLALIIAQARAAVGVDTGLSHLAVALGVPTIAIYTDTDPALTGVMAGAHAPAVNLGNKHQIPSVEMVIQALAEL